MNKMSELLASLKEYYEKCQVPQSDYISIADFNSLVLFDDDIISSNFSSFEILELIDNTNIERKNYEDLISRSTWKMMEISENEYMIVRLIDGKSNELINGKILEIPKDTLLKCVHYAIPKEEYSIYCYFDSIPKHWYPLPRQIIRIGGKQRKN